MRRIFVPLHGPDDAGMLLRLASQLASPFGAQIEAAFIANTGKLDLEPIAPDVPGVTAARAAYEEWSAALARDQVPVRTGWREIPDGVVYASASVGRAADLTVTRSLGRVVEEERIVHAGRGERSFRDALLASGRLTLLAPSAQIDASTLLDRVVIAWDGSAGAARVLGQSLVLLARARSLRVVIVGRNTVGPRAREAIESYIRLYSESASLLVHDNAHRQTGRALVDAMRSEGATLAVMGVVGRSHPGGLPGTLGGTMLKVIEDGRIPILTAG
jgi:hypothetical protein